MYYEIMILGRLILNGSARLDLPFTIYKNLYAKMRQLKTFDVIELGEAMNSIYGVVFIANNACLNSSLPVLISKLIDQDKKREIHELLSQGHLSGTELQEAIAEL